MAYGTAAFISLRPTLSSGISHADTSGHAPTTVGNAVGSAPDFRAHRSRSAIHKSPLIMIRQSASTRPRIRFFFSNLRLRRMQVVVSLFPG
jgi:hypothetical protein